MKPGITPTATKSIKKDPVVLVTEARVVTDQLDALPFRLYGPEGRLVEVAKQVAA
jgi:hypothetical protein